MTVKEIQELIRRYSGTSLPPWEEQYLEFHGARFKDTIDLLGPGQGQRLLDLGAFPGHLTLLAHHLGYQTEGLTGRGESPASLAQIIDRLSRYTIPIAIGEVETESFPYGDESFDVVLALEIIEHLPFNPFRLLRETFRVLKPGGRILISTPNLARLENLLRLLSGHSLHLDIQKRFDEVFSSILSARHVREYTASDLTYMLEGQNKEMYRFEDFRVFYPACSNPPYSWPRLAHLIERIQPRRRSTLLVQARRPRHITLIHPEEVEPTSGFFSVQEHSANMNGIARMVTTPFRWTRGRAELSLPASQAPFQVFSFHLVYLVPTSLPPVILKIGTGEQRLGQIWLFPGREYTPLKVVLPVALAREGRFNLHLSVPTWRPANHTGQDDYEFPLDDERDLGIAMAWDGFLREDCQDHQELLRPINKDFRLFEKFPGVEPRWCPPQPVFLLQDDSRTVLRMGRKDWRHLGFGWHEAETWGDGLIRWSSSLAEAYIAARPGARKLQVRVFTGEPALGEVSGELELRYISKQVAEGPASRADFKLPPAIWTDLIADLPPFLPSGKILKVLLRFDPPRVPARLVSNSRDRRELGLAVAGMALI